ncbi:MAG TPA: HAD family hydrolase [Methylomirabilota bacterium]|nr:HAD family hydrolase [Methylomirabilota bacterium]
MIRAVTFDCWGTLLLDGPASDDRYKHQRLTAIQSILAASGVSTAPRELVRAYLESGRRLGRIWARRRDVPVAEHVRGLLESLDAELPDRLPSRVMAGLVEAYAQPALRVPPKIDEGARGALEELAGRGLALALVSNTMRTPGAVFRRIFDEAGLLAPFKVLTFSDECGIRKPDPEIFLLTLRQIGVAPGEAVHVGDDPVLDVEGARDAGMSVIQVTADGRATGPAKPDAVITRLDHLPAALAGLGA